MVDVVEVNAQTGERIERKFTKTEIAQREKDQAALVALQKAEAEEAAMKAAMKASAVSKLEALGLTVDEVRVAFGLEVE